MGSNEDAAEKLVKTCIARALDAEVRQVDRNEGRRVHDLEIVHFDRDPEPVEVTTAVDEAIRQATEDKGFEPWESKSLALSWTLVSMVPPPKWKPIRKGVEGPLGELERLAVSRFDTRDLLTLRLQAQHGDSDAGAHADAVGRLARLGLLHGSSFPRQAPPNTLCVGIPAEATWDGSARSVSPWVEHFVLDPDRSDNIEKMGAGGHYAIVMDATLAGYTVFRIVEDLDNRDLVPDVCPEIPDVVQELWLFTMTGSGKGLRWKRGTGWSRVPALRS